MPLHLFDAPTKNQHAELGFHPKLTKLLLQLAFTFKTLPVGITTRTLPLQFPDSSTGLTNTHSGEARRLATYICNFSADVGISSPNA